MPCAPSKPSPLKNALGTALEVVVVRTDGPGGIDGHIRDIVNRLKALPKDAVAMAVGHTNTIGLIIKGVSGRNIDPIAENEFDKLFAVATVVSSGTVALMRYGEKTG
jgi:hypothetical protein